MANEQKNYKLTYESFEKATELLITTGTRDSAGILLERGAGLVFKKKAKNIKIKISIFKTLSTSMLKMTDPESALKLYKRALHVADVK